MSECNKDIQLNNYIQVYYQIYFYMYKPRSPTATNKTINFSPSPQSRRKINNKNCIEYHNIVSKSKLPPSTHQEQRAQRKSINMKKCGLKTIEVDPAQLMQEYKQKETSNNNQTPKFCIKPDQFTQQGNPQRVNPLAPSNFFSFGERSHQKLKTERKIKQICQKQANKSPKEVKKKSSTLVIPQKAKPQMVPIQVQARQKKTNQSYIR